MKKRLIIPTALVFALSLVPMRTFAESVAYTFTGTLSGYYMSAASAASAALDPFDPGSFFIPVPTWVALNNSPFEISIISDLMNVDMSGYVAGGGRLSLNNSSDATWFVDGIGTETTDAAQIYAIGGIFRVGFSWDGRRYPYATDHIFPFLLDFSSPDIRSYNQYGRLTGVGEPISVNLISSLTIPPGVISFAPSNTSITIADTTLWLTGMSNVQYSISTVPVPAAIWLFVSAIAGLSFCRRSSKPA